MHLSSLWHLLHLTSGYITTSQCTDWRNTGECRDASTRRLKAATTVVAGQVHADPTDAIPGPDDSASRVGTTEHPAYFTAAST